MKLIALYSSRPQCGKSTVALHLWYEHQFYTEKFAATLKGMTHYLLKHVLHPGFDPDVYIDGPLKETPIPELGGLTARRLMQTLGTEWGRMLDSEFWVRIMEVRLERLTWQIRTDRVVVDDMRFPNEYDMLKRRGALMVKVERSGPHLGATHASEGALDQHYFHATINNDGTLEDLYTQIDTLVK